jgi:hypothetical protein
MPKGSSKSTAVIERLLEQRRQYEAWIARLSAAEDSTPAHVRERVKADYEARLGAVLEELKAHADSARQTIEQRQHFRLELKKKERLAAERLAETELRHAVGEYDDAAWGQVHKDAQAELVTLREELQAVEADIEKLQELDTLVRGAPPKRASGEHAVVRGAAPPPQPRDGGRPPLLDELAFIKSVTEDDKGNAPSPRRASGEQYQPNAPLNPNPAPLAPPPQSPTLPTPAADAEDLEDPRPLKCRDCGTMNLPTEWYCEQCGAELAAV